MRKMTRMECSKEARRVLNRHGVDLGYCQYSCTGYEIRMTGWLCKHDGSDFNGQQIEAMINDFKSQLDGFAVFGDLDNWQFSSDQISKLDGGDDEVITEHEDVRYEIDSDYEDVG